MGKLPFSTKFAYGFAGIGDAIIYNLTGTFLIFFLNTVVGMNPVLSGAVAAVGAIWETVWGGVMGYISDNTATRLGRRKPYILAGAFPMAVITTLTFTSIDAPDGVRFLYYCLMLMAYWTCFTTFFVPYLACGADLTDDYNERTVLRGYTFIFDAFGAAISMTFPTVLVDSMVKMGTGDEIAWSSAAFFCGLVSAVTILFMGFKIKDKDQLKWENEHHQKAQVTGILKVVFAGKKIHGPRDGAAAEATPGNPDGAAEKATPGNPDGAEPTPRGNGRFAELRFAMADMLRNFADIFRLPDARFIILASMLFLMGYAMFTADRIYYLNYNTDLTSHQITIVLIYISLLTILYVPVLNLLCRAFDKRSVYLAGMTVSAGLMIVAGFMDVRAFWQMFIIGAVFNVSNSCYWHLMPSMIYDVCEADHLASGKRRGGIVVSLQALSESAGNAVGMQILGIVLALGNFDESAKVQSDSALALIDAAMFIMPAAFMLLSAAMVFKYSITKEKYQEILSLLETMGKR